MAVPPGEIDELARPHEVIAGGLLPPVEVIVIVPQDLEVDAPLESVAVMVTVKVPVEL